MTKSPLVPQVDLTAHLRLCHTVAQSFRAFVGKGIDYDDLYQAAFEGMHFAACRFDPKKAKFSTFALPMARFAVMKMIRESRTAVREPQKKLNTMYEFSLDQPNRGAADRSERHTDDRGVLGGLGTGASNLPDSALPADVLIDRGRRARALAWAIRKLPPRPRRVLHMRLDGGTLASIGAELGISRERVRQLEAKALTALRAALKKYREVL